MRNSVKYEVITFITRPIGNHTILHSRECISEGSQLHWADRVFYDGEVYLTLDHDDVWTAQVPQALTLKGLLMDLEAQRARAERIRLQEECVKLMRELRLSEEPSSISSGIFHSLIKKLRDFVRLCLPYGA